MGARAGDLELGDERQLQHAHEAREHEQVNFCFLQSQHVSALGFVFEFGAEFSRSDEPRRKVALSSMFENACALHVAQYNGDFGRDLTRGHGVSEGDEIGTFAGTEHTQAESTFTVHELFLPVATPQPQAFPCSSDRVNRVNRVIER